MMKFASTPAILTILACATLATLPIGCHSDKVAIGQQNSGGQISDANPAAGGASGGATSTGGVIASGGVKTGGATGAGGTSLSGGTSSSHTSSATTVTGGSSGVGGTTNTQSSQTGTSTGGSKPTGGGANTTMTSVGGKTGTGGSTSTATGGTRASGGSTSTSGAGGAGGGTKVQCRAAGTFTVTNQGMSAYLIDGTANPTLTLCRGSTYVFAISATGHPFYIKTAQSTGAANAYSMGVTGNGTAMGDVTFIVPMAAPNTLFYDCSLHSMMTGTLNIVN